MRNKVLIADDDPVVRHLLTSILLSAGFEVLQVETGSDCLAKITELQSLDSPLCLLFLDLQLADMSGSDVLAQIRATESKRLPVVMLSANSEAEVRQRFPDLDADIYLEKPFPPGRAVSVANSLIGPLE